MNVDFDRTLGRNVVIERVVDRLAPSQGFRPSVTL
jgi:hypothetical protein